MKRFVYHDMLTGKARLIAGSLHRQKEGMYEGYWFGELNLYAGTKECEEDYIATVTIAFINSWNNNAPLWEHPLYQTVAHCVREEEYRWDGMCENESWLEKEVLCYFPDFYTDVPRWIKQAVAML